VLVSAVKTVTLTLTASSIKLKAPLLKKEVLFFALQLSFFYNIEKSQRDTAVLNGHLSGLRFFFSLFGV